MNRQAIRLWAAAWMAAGVGLAAAAGEAGGGASPLNDYEDWLQQPIRNADIAKLAADADLVTVASFDQKKWMDAQPATNRWGASVPAYHEGFRMLATFKGGCGRQIIVEGDPAAFANPAPLHISSGSFRPANDYLLFLKAVGSNAVYRCLAANPGGFRVYAGRGDSDHRKMLAGAVNGAVVVEAARGYHGDRMNGPSNMRDVMEGIRSPLKLTATAKGGAAVELRFENTGRGPVSIPKDPKLFAPVLWAEVEGEGTDSVLLSPDDYLLTKFSNPYKDMQNIAPGGAATVTVELPTGPVPPGATLRWALNNHVKPLAGSLPAGECEARLLFRPAKDIIVMSNPVRVTGRAGGAGPAQLAGLDRPPAYAPVVDPKPDTPLPPLAEQLKGRIWFDTDRDGNWEIYAMDANGSNSVNVSRSPDTDEFGVAVSPDGKRIAYQAGGRKSGDGGYWGRSSPDGKAIWVADSGGGNARKIAENAINPAWWPDGTALLYSSKKDGYCMQNLETGAVTQLLREVSGWLNFSPSGFCPGTRQVLGGGGLNTTLCGMTVVVDLDERARFRDFTALTTTYRGCTQRWLSPAGRRVIFAHHDPKHNGAIILWSTSPDGTDPRRFARTGESWPGYGSYGESPDGTLHVAASWGNLYVGRYADGAQKQLTNKQGSNMSPVWTAAAVPPGRK